MKAILIKEFGGPQVLQLADVADPVPGKHEVLVRIHATAVNRADLLQREGRYPPPKDAPEHIPGLEFAGEIVAMGEAVSQWQVGDRVFGIAGGGTYAELIAAHSRTVARIPNNLTYTDAAAVPEAFITAYDAIIKQCGLGAGERLLVTAAGSGVGTAAIQIGCAIGATVIGTARSDAKLRSAQELGLHHAINSTSGSYARQVLEVTAGDGFDVALELVGGSYFNEDLLCAATKARIIVVGLVGGASAQIDLGVVLRKRLRIFGTTLRMRPLEEKIEATNLLSKNLCPLFATAKLKPIVESVSDLKDAAAVHQSMQQNENYGKMVLRV